MWNEVLTLMRPNRILLMTTTPVLALSLWLSGCTAEPEGSDNPSTTVSESAQAKNEATTEFQPVSITHALGTAEIKQRPQRIVTLGQGAAETAIALGTTPVGMESYPWGADDSGYLPWVKEAVEKNSEELPQLITGGTELDMEAIVKLKPDLILAPWSGITQEQYDLLAAMAPTVAYPEEPWVTPWETEIEMVAKALGKPEKAKELVAEIEAEFKEAAKPEYGKYTYSYIYNDGPGTLGIFFESEQRAAMVSALGLKFDPVAETFRDKEVPGTDSALIGLENADKLKDSDLIFTFYASPENRKEIEAQPLYAQIPAVKRGSVVAPTDQSLVTASSMINPLTVPWMAKRYKELIDEAIKKVEEK